MSYLLLGYEEFLYICLINLLNLILIKVYPPHEKELSILSFALLFLFLSAC